MTRFMYDGVTPRKIPDGASMVAGYADGHYANLREMAARFPHAIRVSIAVRYTTKAQVLDVELGDATPDQAVLWCTHTMASTPNKQLTVYCNLSMWPAVRAAFRAVGVTEPNYWVAHYDGVASIPAGAIAKQYKNTPGYDESVVADYWPGVDHAFALESEPADSELYPGASTSHWYETAYPGDPMHVNTIVWHSTESTGLPGYAGGSVAPTLTAVPNWSAERLDWFQHFPFDRSARALVHHRTQIGTNTLNVAQVEIVGTCAPDTHAHWDQAGIRHLYMPELPPWAVDGLTAFARWAHDAHGVPLASGLTWNSYPASYGAANGVRMSTAQWQEFRGHCGHQHVPENDHGDPGLFPIASVLFEGDVPRSDAPAAADSAVPAVVARSHPNS
ncbi:hypothetical protein ACFY20_30220 [Streptomyces sp. NPDC001312]|uniref:hypothetical protein n=1 Tax=Streptomyces sp. NPDC001312 TaxID=3364561 RepID=UPI0036879FB4